MKINIRLEECGDYNILVWLSNQKFEFNYAKYNRNKP